jgi:hypothetical protein
MEDSSQFGLHLLSSLFVARAIWQQPTYSTSTPRNRKRKRVRKMEKKIGKSQITPTKNQRTTQCILKYQRETFQRTSSKYSSPLTRFHSTSTSIRV